LLAQKLFVLLLDFFRGTLADAISRGAMLATVDGIPQLGSVDVLHVLATAREIASALMYLHSQNVLHGDLNGNNILLVGSTPTPVDTRSFSAKVADFGLSRMLAPGGLGLGILGCGEGGTGMEMLDGSRCRCEVWKELSRSFKGFYLHLITDSANAAVALLKCCGCGSRAGGVRAWEAVVGAAEDRRSLSKGCWLRGRGRSC
jgi:serine/threonine protein kinase